MRMHTQLTKKYCSLALPGSCRATYSSLSFKSGCWIHAEQPRKCTWTLPPGTDSKGQTDTVIRHAKTIYHEQVPHHLVVTFCCTCHNKLNFLVFALQRIPSDPFPHDKIHPTLHCKHPALAKGTQVWELSCTASTCSSSWDGGQKSGKENKILEF